jgi:phosphate starvation-inducible PhoH-like protein
MKVLRGIDDIAIHEFNERDVVRHRLVQKIVVAYDKYERENRAREEEKREEKKFKIVKRDKA